MSNPKKVEPLKASDRVAIIDAVNARLRKLTAPGGVELVGGDGITIENNEISATPYTAGENVTIEDRVISCTAEGKTYTAGEGIAISDADVISGAYKAGTGISIAHGTITGAYKAGTGIAISSGTISGFYKAGTGISISGGTISGNYKAGTGISISSGTISATPYTAGTGIVISEDNEISGAYKAGDNVTITDGKIYSKNTEYTAGTGINISSDYVISAETSTSDAFEPYMVEATTQWNGGYVTGASATITPTVTFAGFNICSMGSATMEAGKTYNVLVATLSDGGKVEPTAKALYPIIGKGALGNEEGTWECEYSQGALILSFTVGASDLEIPQTDNGYDFLFAIPCKPITD